MKVLFIASDNNCTSGAFLSMAKLNQILNQNFHIDSHIILPTEGEGAKLLDELGISYSYVKSYSWVIPLSEKRRVSLFVKKKIYQIFNWFSIKKIKKHIDINHYDLVHINTTYPYVGAKAAISTKTPFVWHLREYLEEDQNRCIWDKCNGYKLIERADSVVSISTDLKEKYKKLLNTQKLQVVLNGIDTALFYKPDHEIFQRDKITLIYGGGYSVLKGIYELAAALSLLKLSNICDFDVWFLGNAPEKYIKYIQKLGLANNCMFLGYQKDVSVWYEKADIAFTCSACEGFGRKTVEAALGGALIIGANTGGTLDIIEHEKTGLLYKQGDAVDLFNKCVYAIEHKTLAKQIAKNGQEYALKNLSALKNAEDIVAIYHEVLADQS